MHLCMNVLHRCNPIMHLESRRQIMYSVYTLYRTIYLYINEVITWYAELWELCLRCSRLLHRRVLVRRRSAAPTSEGAEKLHGMSRDLATFVPHATASSLSVSWRPAGRAEFLSAGSAFSASLPKSRVGSWVAASETVLRLLLRGWIHGVWQLCGLWNNSYTLVFLFLFFNLQIALRQMSGFDSFKKLNAPTLDQVKSW